MNEQDRQFYIDWLLIAYPFKAASYFEGFGDKELIVEFERISEYL